MKPWSNEEVFGQTPQIKFFLGAATPGGFVSRFDELTDLRPGSRLYLLKGGPGCGKSTMLRKLNFCALQREEPVELICCSADPSSLDAIILPQRRVSAADATAPHLLEPKYPGCYETLVTTDSCWDQTALSSHREEIIHLTEEKARCTEHAGRFLSAAGFIRKDSSRFAAEAMDVPKLTRFAQRLCQREFPREKPSAEPQKEKIRFLSAITGEGVCLLAETARALAKSIYIIEDDYGCVSQTLLELLRKEALSRGLALYSCYCPLSPFHRLEHLFLPELSLAFLTSNRFHPVTGQQVGEYRRINSSRFYHEEQLREKKKRLRHYQAAADQMLTEAMLRMQEGAKAHRELEAIYHSAILADELDRLGWMLTKRVFGSGA